MLFRPILLSTAVERTTHGSSLLSPHAPIAYCSKVNGAGAAGCTASSLVVRSSLEERRALGQRDLAQVDLVEPGAHVHRRDDLKHRARVEEHLQYTHTWRGRDANSSDSASRGVSPTRYIRYIRYMRPRKSRRVTDPLHPLHTAPQVDLSPTCSPCGSTARPAGRALANASTACP